MNVPLLDLHAQNDPILNDIKSNLDKVFATHKYILGPQLDELEEQISDFCGTRHAIGCASGTDALLLALMALGIKDGDEVITPSFTFFSTASCIHRIGAKPVFADINPETFNIDPDEIEKAITPRTKAIIVVHLFGQAAEMDVIMTLARKHDLKVIEDNAQGIGGKFKGKIAGSMGDVGSLSFFPSKNLGAMGDAGMCITNDEDIYKKIKLLRHHGENPKYIHRWVGLNSRLDTIQAAVLLAKLPHLGNWSLKRRENAEYYFRELKNVPEIILPIIHPDAESIFNQFTLRAIRRDELMQYLKDHDIGCAVYYPKPLHIQDCFAYLGYEKDQLPNSEKASREVISIPIYSELTRAQQEYVANTIKEFYS